MDTTSTNLTGGVIEGVHTKHWSKETKQLAEDCMVNTTTVEQGLIVCTEKHVFKGGMGVTSNGYSGSSPVASMFVFM